MTNERFDNGGQAAICFNNVCLSCFPGDLLEHLLGFFRQRRGRSPRQSPVPRRLRQSSGVVTFVPSLSVSRSGRFG